MAEKKDNYQPPVTSGGSHGGSHGLPSQESIDLLTRLLQEFERRSTSTSTIPPEVARDIAIVNAAVESIESALSLKPSPITIASVTPNRGSTAGGETITISGSHLLPGSTVFFGNTPATSVTVVSLTEIKAVAPGRPTGPVDVFVNTFAGGARSVGGYTYQQQPY